MKKRSLFIVLSVFILVFVAACTPAAEPEPAPEAEVDEPAEQEREEAQDTEEESEQEAPEETEVETPEEEEEVELSEELKELLSLSDERVKNVNYRYKDPSISEKFYEFWIKGDKIKYTLNPTFKDVRLDEGAYDTVFLNTKEKTAEGHCTGQTCKVKGKKTNLVYEEAYIWTPFDWNENIQGGSIYGEETVDKRKASRVETSNLGSMWIDTYYGLPLQIIIGENLYQIVDVDVNNVRDEDVEP